MASSRAKDTDSTLGLILDGGLGSRMGGADKGLIQLGGRPLLAHLVERFRPQCAALALNANGDSARFASFGLSVIADDPQDFAGPLAGILAGLDFSAWRAPHTKYMASLPADTPFAPSDFVARLHEARLSSGATIAVAASGGRMHHVAALWPVALADDLRRALVGEGQRKAERFVARYPLAIVEWPSEPLDPFFNVNTPDDLARAEAMLRRSSAPDAP
jgi:molybdopterin-guanine dinucleotide biosynthesis protein A